MLDEESVRLAKLRRLEEEDGITSYSSLSRRSHTARQFLDGFSQFEISAEKITLAGRVLVRRQHGAIMFLSVMDASGRVQWIVRKNIVGDALYARLENEIDPGDFLEAHGSALTSKTGEPSLEVAGFRLLSKALLPLPEKFHGLADIETRYRKRYLDLIANPEVKEIFEKRSLIVRKIREFLDAEGFMEVETPILQTIAGGAAARPFITHHNALDIDLFLRIAPELYLKRLIVGGFEKVYEVSRCFRNEGVSFQHNPEFTQVEFYWAYADYEDLMKITERLMVTLVSAVTGGKLEVLRDQVVLNFNPPFPRLDFRTLVKHKTGIDLEKADNEELLREELVRSGLKLETEQLVGYGELCDALYKEFVRPQIIQPSFVIDYPAEMIPLAKRKDNDSSTIATTQLVVQGMELTKAYNELNDPLDQEQRLLIEERKRSHGSLEVFSADADFIEALKHGMPPTAGFGMGIDRLCLILLGLHSIKEVILFPTMKKIN